MKKALLILGILFPLFCLSQNINKVVTIDDKVYTGDIISAAGQNIHFDTGVNPKLKSNNLEIANIKEIHGFLLITTKSDIQKRNSNIVFYTENGLIDTTKTKTLSYQPYNQELSGYKYKASNGINYQIGDTIKLGRGSAQNGDFNYLQMGGMYNTLSALNGKYNDISSSIGRNYSGLNVVLKKIKRYKLKGAESIVFVVGGGNITNYNLMIEDAIATCEIADCIEKVQKVQIVRDTIAPPPSKYDEIKKLKELLDIGAITQEEYDLEKKKILEK